MIASVAGIVRLRRTGFTVVECGGVGYGLAVSQQTLDRIPAVGANTFLYTHLVMREEGLHLYGFCTEEERELFLLLVGVQGVGPRVALAVLSSAGPRELLAAIANGDVGRFRSVQGIGKRTAERIIVELKEKVSERALEAAPQYESGVGGARLLAREGLVSLGFGQSEADELLARSDGETAEALIAEALKAAHE
jgi:holliday junction DNA helicase RuvA